MPAMDKVTELDMRPLTPERWRDVETIFNSRGCSVARGCWCMYYRHSGAAPQPAPGRTVSQQRKAELKRLAEQDPPPGLIAYRDDEPVGWVSLGPREDFAKLRRSPVMKPVDEQPVWSIVCFVVPGEHRGQGIARALLDGAIDYAQDRGVDVLEAYPVDTTGRMRDDSLWFGSKAMFDEAGFVEVARRKPARPVVRLFLKPRGRTGGR